MNLSELVGDSASVTLVIMVGIYFIFSNTVMRSLKSMDLESGARVMVGINKDILNPTFKLIFTLSALGALYLAVNGVAQSNWLQMWAGAVFFLGTTLVTILFNIPLNENLRRSVEGENEIVRTWQHYLVVWTRWNHLRSFSAVASSFLLLSAQ